MCVCVCVCVWCFCCFVLLFPHLFFCSPLLSSVYCQVGGFRDGWGRMVWGMFCFFFSVSFFCSFCVSPTHPHIANGKEWEGEWREDKRKKKEKEKEEEEPFYNYFAGVLCFLICFFFSFSLTHPSLTQQPIINNGILCTVSLFFSLLFHTHTLTHSQYTQYTVISL